MEFDIQHHGSTGGLYRGGIVHGPGRHRCGHRRRLHGRPGEHGHSRNPEMSGDIFKNMLVGQAVAESAAIFALVIAILLLFLERSRRLPSEGRRPVGSRVCAWVSAPSAPGIGSGFPGGEACLGIARQPAVSSRLTTNMLIGSAVCQTPAIFSMVIALMLMFHGFAQPPAIPHLGGPSGGRSQHGPGGHRIRLPAAGWLRAPAVRASPGSPRAWAGDHDHAGGSGGIPDPFHFWSFGQFYSDVQGFSGIHRPERRPWPFWQRGSCMGFGGIGPGIGNGMAAEGAVRWVAGMWNTPAI